MQWQKKLSVVAAVSVGLAAGGAFATPGDHLWSQSFGDASQQFSEDVAVDGAGNTAVVGQYTGGAFNLGTGTLPLGGYYFNLYLAKYDSTGAALWSRSIAGIDDDDFGFVGYERRIAFDAAGNLFIAGNYYGTPDFGCGPLTRGNGSAFVAKLDTAGQCVWSSAFPGAYVENPRLAVASNGSGLALAGRFQGTLNFGGGPLTTTGQWGVFVARLDGSGNHVWSKRFETTNGGAFASAVGVAIDGAGRTVLAGGFSGSTNLGANVMNSHGGQDAFVARYNATGGLMWGRHFGDAADQVAHGVVADAAGNIVLTGGFAGTLGVDTVSLSAQSASDAFLVKVDGTGHGVWGRQFTDAFGAQHGVQVSLDAAGNIATSGEYTGSIDLGAGPIENEGDFKRYVAKFDSAGTLLWGLPFVSDNAGFEARMGVGPSGDMSVAGQYTGFGYFYGNVFQSQGNVGVLDVFLAHFQG
ncbi:hypothetical protein KRR26_05765 [Corallococcus sp. M34]|uniref:hypothetical protein n=1 Tax=Citreicoccus inhibens TaxID=2849499 RepID=UPI001C22EE28|nr:hypothetical protein [Citreicoccus inhibens]MBU8895100.1 hypothetical protein [Citreicoccus inhibens]